MWFQAADLDVGCDSWLNYKALTCREIFMINLWLHNKAKD